MIGRLFNGFASMPCSRESFLDEKEAMRKQREEMELCHKINTKPGYETLTKMKFKE